MLGVTEAGVSLLTSGAAPAPELTIVTGPRPLPVPHARRDDQRPDGASARTSASLFRAELDATGPGHPEPPGRRGGAAAPAPPQPRPSCASPSPPPQQLQGSILSADTWRQAAAALRSRRAG